MIGALTNHLWQSTVFAAAAGLLTVGFRSNRAQVRYWLWFSASFKFFVPFSLLISLGSRLGWAPAAKKIAAPVLYDAASFTMVQVSRPFTVLPSAHATAGTIHWVPVSVLSVWAIGLATIALIRFRGWLRIQAALRSSTPIDIPVPVEIRSSPGLLEPGVVGLFHSILLVPAGIVENLTPNQLDAVLAHELCHIRRRDNLSSAIHMVVEAIFWFHPFVWWIGARLVEERERACDEEVLRLGGEPQVYAEGILKVCRSYLESPLRCVSGVTGANLKRRIQTILAGRVPSDLGFARKAALAMAGIAALATPLAVGIINAPVLRAQSQSSDSFRTGETPKFDVSYLGPCRDGEPSPGGGRGGAAGKTVISISVDSKGNFVVPDLPPGSLNVNCESAAGLIRMAYVLFANGRLNPSLAIQRQASLVPILGPDWINSDRYDIDAKPEGTPSREMMNGPMLQALLEDRFKLTIHRETKEVPVYALTVASGGLKAAPFQEGSCLRIDFNQLLAALNRVKYGSTLFEPALPPNFCQNGGGGTESIFTFDAQGVGLEEFTRTLLAFMDRPVINKTGVAGLFNFHLEVPIDKNVTPGGPPPAAIFTTLEEQLGLKLEPARGLQDFLVVDHVEKPSGN
jgi:bla regulator protein BlaR1